MIDVAAYCMTHAIQYHSYTHPAVWTVAEAATIKNTLPGMHCKTLLVVTNEKKFYLVGMPAAKRLDTKKLAGFLGVKWVGLASPDDVEVQLHVKPGNVSIFCALNNAHVGLIIDSAVMQAAQSGFHPNVNTETWVLDQDNLQRYLNSLENETCVYDL